MSEQNIFDNQIFFDGYKALRDCELNANELIEQPAMRKLLPEIKNKSVLDLGCGYGHNCIDFINLGAKKVIGVDLSEKMLEVAKKESCSEGIEYINMNMKDIGSLNRKYDVIYSSLAFHYIKDFSAFAEELYSVLNIDGYLIFSQEHPIITATVDGKGHFNKDENGNRISYTFSDYNLTGERKVRWYIDGVIKYHRTFGDIINALSNAGFFIESVCEPTPEDWAVKKLPTMTKEYIKPNFLIVKAKKIMR